MGQSEADLLQSSLTVTANAPPPPPAPPAPAAARPHGFFDNFLSELNPLQYVPVVGTIYRAITGDTISEEARFAGSLVVSGLTGGPIGIGLNVGTAALEHLLGIDPEKIGDQLLAELGIGGGAKAAAPAPATTASAAAPTPTLSTPIASTPIPSTPAATVASAGGWSPAQLAAYGVKQSAQGGLARGNESGADVLNGLELAELRAPAAA